MYDARVKISNITILNVQICVYETIENKSMVKNIDNNYFDVDLIVFNHQNDKYTQAVGIRMGVYYNSYYLLIINY